MADYKVKVSADSKQALSELKNLNSQVKDVARTHRLSIDTQNLNSVTDRVTAVKDGLGVAKNNIKQFYSVSKSLPFIGKQVHQYEQLAFRTRELALAAPKAAAGLTENAKAGNILKNSFGVAARSTSRLIDKLAQLGFALYGLKEAQAILKAAFGGFFDTTIGRQIRLQETILKTQTALASTSKVFKGGVEITDPYEKIVTLTGAVEKHIDNIRKRSIELAGVTSGEVIEVFGMVAQQVGQIGAGLDEAEDLAINFAAALGTFGLPLYQARQEIGSILRGDITPDSYLAKALGIDNPAVEKAKASTEGLVGFLEKRLAAAVAGQRIAAEGFAGVTSNIAEIGEEISRKFGSGLLDPLLNGLTKVFEALFGISKEMWDISEAFGSGLGNVLSTGIGSIGSGNTFIKDLGAQISEFAKTAASEVDNVFGSLERRVREFAQPFRDLINEAIKIVAQLGKGLAALAAGFADLSIETLKSVVNTLALLATGFTVAASGAKELLTTYGQILRAPIVQYFAQIAASMAVMNAVGITSAVKFGVIAVVFITKWKLVVAFVKKAFIKIRMTLSALAVLVGQAMVKMAGSIDLFLVTLSKTNPQVAVLTQQLRGLTVAMKTAGTAAQQMATSAGAASVATSTAVTRIKAAILGFIKMNAVVLAVTVGLTILVDVLGRYNRAQEKAAQEKRFESAMRRRAELLAKEASGAKLSASETMALADAENALTGRIREQSAAVEELKNKIVELEKWKSSAAATGIVGVQDFAGSRRLKRLKAELEQLQKELADSKALLDKKAREDQVRLDKLEKIQLAKEVAALERQFANDNFQAKQALEQARIELIQKGNELEILGIEKANELRQEGEEGAALKAGMLMDRLFVDRKRREMNLQSQRQRLALDLNAIEKRISDYKFETQKKINELRRKQNIDDLQTAELKRQLEEKTISQKEYDRKKQELIEKREKGDAETLGTGNPTNEILTRQLMAVKEEINSMTDRLVQAEGEKAQRQAIKDIFPIEELTGYQRKLERIKAEIDKIRSKGALFDKNALDLELSKIEKMEDLVSIQKTIIERLTDAQNRNLITQEAALKLRKLIDEIGEKHVERENEILNKVKETNEALALRKGLLESANNTRSLENRLEESKMRYRLEVEGLRSELIEAELEKERIRKRYEALKVGTDAAGSSELDTRAQREAELVDQLAQQAIQGANPIFQLLKQYKLEIEDVSSSVVSLASTITSELGSAMAQSIEALIEGTGSVKDIFADMFKSIGRAFIEMATQMIAKAIMMKALGIFLPGAGSAGAAAAPEITGVGAAFGMRTGGIASGPETGYTATLHGTEAVVPLPNGREIPVELSGGGGGPVNSVVNVTISDSGTTVNRDRASNLGKMIETSVINIITRERRPGGMLRN